MVMATALSGLTMPSTLEEAVAMGGALEHNVRVTVCNYYNGFESWTDQLSLIKDLTFVYLVWNLIWPICQTVRGYGVIGSIKKLVTSVSKVVAKAVLQLPIIKPKVEAELESTKAMMYDMIIKNDLSLLQFPVLPQEGLEDRTVLEELDKLQLLEHSDWSKGRVSGGVYHGGNDLLQLQADAYAKYSIANQLHPDVFPGVRKMESEIVSMVLDIFNAPKETGCGCTSSGGTESLLLAGLAAREYGKRKKGIAKPEVIAPITIHAGIEKACYYFGMKLHKVELDPDTYKVDLGRVKKLINSNTVLLVGSAPNYPHGIIDDIEGLSKLAVKYNIPLHVDACLGSFVVSFLEPSKVHGEDVKLPLFDYRLPGVTSISCDTHKYGFAPKGSSVITYRSKELRECQYYILVDWTGGMYGSPTLAGSRPGALSVGCWATMVHFGKEGYKKSCTEIVKATMKLKKAIKTHKILLENLEIIGDPIVSVLAFKVKNEAFNAWQLADILSAKGWHFATLQNPAALHFALTRLTVPVVDELIEDVVAAVKEAIAMAESNPKKLSGDTAAIYGVAGSVHTGSIAGRIISVFLDGLYETKP